MTLMGLNFDNSFVRELPADPLASNSRRQVSGACYSRVDPTPVSSPRLFAHAVEVSTALGISEADVRQPEFADVFGGNTLLEGMEPHAACYGGHQFGNWAGQLGDGRAISLGEVVNAEGERWEVQLKGAGPTPYSRMGDGRAVMRSSVREFLCSEAMYHLGVPTTRALCLIGTGDEVVRDMFYDGHPGPEPGAVVCRVAPSFIRFGNFEIFASRQENDVLSSLAAHTVRRHAPHLGEPGPEVYLRWLEEICELTAEMVSHWLRVGFVHGVMNTDNMSVLGLTIDYGPYGWLDDFDPSWTPNTTDMAGKRYRFGQQSNIALWNLIRFANALYPLVGEVEPLEEALKAYGRRLSSCREETFARKLGIEKYRPAGPVGSGDLGDDALVDELHVVLQLVETDMSIFYRKLADVPVGEGAQDASAGELVAPLMECWYAPDALTEEHREQVAAWLRRYISRLLEDGLPAEIRRARMNAANPKYVLRNYVAQLAIDAAERGDPSLVQELLEVMRRPYDEQPGKERFAEKRPDWARTRAGCSMLSCSS